MKADSWEWDKYCNLIRLHLHQNPLTMTFDNFVAAIKNISEINRSESDEDPSMTWFRNQVGENFTKTSEEQNMINLIEGKESTIRCFGDK